MCDLYVSLEACYGDPAWYVCAFIYVGCALGLGFYGGALGGDLQCGNKVHFFVVFNTLCSICRMCLVAEMPCACGGSRRTKHRHRRWGDYRLHRIGGASIARTARGDRY